MYNFWEWFMCDNSELSCWNFIMGVNAVPIFYIEKSLFMRAIKIIVLTINHKPIPHPELSWQICLICLIFLPNWKTMWMPNSFIHGLDCLNWVIWPFTLTGLSVGSCLYYALLRHLTWEFYYPFVEKFYCSPIL